MKPQPRLGLLLAEIGERFAELAALFREAPPASNVATRKSKSRARPKYVPPSPVADTDRAAAKAALQRAGVDLKGGR